MIAQSAFEQFSGVLGFDYVAFMPAGNPPHRHQETDLLAADWRLRLVEAATAHSPHFRVNDFECKKAGRSYTVDTLRALAQAKAITLPVPFIIGSDALRQLDSWHEPQALMEMVHFLQAPRPESHWVDSVFIAGETRPLATSRIEMPPLGISSTWIRQQLSAGTTPESVRHYLPEPVRRLIHWNRLYQPSATNS